MVIELEFTVAHLIEKIPLSTAKTNYKLNLFSYDAGSRIW